MLLFVRVGSTQWPAEVVGAFEGGTMRVLRAESARLARRAVLWSKSSFAASVGYVEHQWDAA